MRRSYLDFALLSEGRLETIDALFEMEQLSRDCSSRWEGEERVGVADAESQRRRMFTSIFNVIKRCLGLGKSGVGNQRGNDGNTKTRQGITT